MKKLKNIHKNIISHIGAANPISFVTAIIEVPGPVIVHQGKYRGKFTPKKGKRK